MDYRLIIWLAAGLVGSVLGFRREQAGLGFIIGFLLGPIGWILLLSMSEEAGVGALFAAVIGTCLAITAATFLWVSFNERPRKSAFRNPLLDVRWSAPAPAATPPLYQPLRGQRLSPQEANAEILRKYGTAR